jgi:hypothetical protein
MGTAFDCFFAMHQQKRQPECGERCKCWLAGLAGWLAGCTALMSKLARRKPAKPTFISEAQQQPRDLLSRPPTSLHPAHHTTPHRYLAGNQT